MSKLNHLSQTPSEIGTLANRGYRLLSKLGEGSYAKVTKLGRVFRLHLNIIVFWGETGIP